MKWTVLDAHGVRGRVEVDDVTTRQDGSLIGLRRADGSKPIHLVPVFVIAGGRWTSAWADGAEIQWDTPAPDPPAEPRLTANATDIPDVFAGRRAVVDARLANLGDDHP